MLQCGLNSLVAAVVSLLASCKYIQTPSNVQRRQMRLRKNVKYCLLHFIISLTFENPLNLKKDKRIKITVSVINKHGNLNKSCIDHNIYFIWTSP